MGQFIASATGWWQQHWAATLWIAVFVVLGKLGLRAVRRRILKAADDGDDSHESGKEKRAKTVAGLVLTTGNALIAVLAGTMALRIFGVDTVPILAGAGVIGVAIGVSLQALIKDLMSGMFIVAENQYAVGDKVKIGELEGVVHKVNLRTTVLLDDEGNPVFLTNGSVTSVINYSLGESLKAKADKAAAPAAPPEPPAAQPPAAQAAEEPPEQAQEAAK